MKNERGFTLVEVLASLVIISIVLMSFMAIFGNTNRIAVSNSEKLVVINLADAYLERLKADPEGTINLVGSSYPPPSNEISFPLTLGNCGPNQPVTKKCLKIELNKLDPINERYYDVIFNFSQNTLPTTPGQPKVINEVDLSLLDVVVEVKARNSNTRSSVEGYISYE